MRVGVVGLGFGASVHVPALRRIAGVEVVALAGSDARAGEAAARVGVPLGVGSAAELLALSPDAVTIAVPPDRQPELASAFMGAGIPVLAEKPLAATVEQAERLAILGRTVTSGIDFEFAELATFRTLRELVHGGAYGAVRSVDVVWRTRPRSAPSPTSWKQDGARGGGVLALLGSHVLFLLEWLFGPVEVIDAAESGPARLELSCRAGGAPVAVVLDNAAGERRHEWRVELERETLAATNTGLDAVQGFSLRGGSGDVLAREPADPDEDGRVAAVSAVAERFLAAVAAGTAAAPDLEAGLRVQRLMASVQDAARE